MANSYNSHEVQQAISHTMNRKYNQPVAIEEKKIMILPFCNPVSSQMERQVHKFGLRSVFHGGWGKVTV